MTRVKEVDVEPEVVLREGKPVAVILDIDQYQAMLERLEEIDDLEAIKRARLETNTFRSLDDFLEEYSPPDV